jgi:hypothetical protein
MKNRKQTTYQQGAHPLPDRMDGNDDHLLDQREQYGPPEK